MLNIETRLVTLAGREKGLSIVVALMLSVSGLLVTLVITDVGSAGFLVILLVSHVKAASTAVDIGFLSTGFLVILVITEFLLHVKAVSAIIRPRLSGTGLLVVIIAGFPAADVIGAGLGAGFLIVLIALLSAMFLSLVKVALTGRDTTAYTEPLIPLHLNTTVFLDLDQAIVKVVL
jgi:hypothetical protein